MTARRECESKPEHVFRRCKSADEHCKIIQKLQAHEFLRASGTCSGGDEHRILYPGADGVYCNRACTKIPDPDRLWICHDGSDPVCICRSVLSAGAQRSRQEFEMNLIKVDMHYKELKENDR